MAPMTQSSPDARDTEPHDDSDAPRHETIDLGHITLHTLEWGPVDGPVAVCLHGFPDSAWTWRLLAPELVAAGYRVVAPFTRGYAPSDIPRDKDFHVAALAYDAREIHRAVGAGPDAVLIGHDWGALTVNALSHRSDNPYSAVVAMSVPPIPAIRSAVAEGPGAVRLLARQATMSWYIGFNQLPWLPERSLGWLIPLLWRRWRLRRPGTPRPNYDLDIDRALAALPTREHRTAVLGYYRAMLRPRTDTRYADLSRDWLREPLCRTLYLHGADDGCMQARLTDHVRGVLPHGSATAVIADAGHFLHLDSPEEVNRRIVMFVAGTRGDEQGDTGPASFVD
ncbi:putative hydrolase [Gordonia namibiensis NBRC 108229]|uniref:Putative hydrolase n=2 Tax=Gordonia namibiensis TaxID=168480 RepID=K6WT13_9ACTN|nr:putative hydrolase [Gordonia namibiensis NBRC 108229]